MKASDFNKLSKAKKLSLLKSEGEYLVARIYEGFNVSLFACSGLYVEVWQRFGLNYIEFIDVLNTHSQLGPYLDKLKIDPDLLDS